MANHNLLKSKYGDNHYKVTTETYVSDSYADEHWRLFLRDEIIMDKEHHAQKFYRLHAQKPHNEVMAMAYNIECPECKTILKKITPIRDYYDLGLYECPVCKKR